MRKILIIDDEQSMLEFLQIVLAKEGYDVAAAEEPERGLSMACEGQFDIVIADIKMEPLDGLEVLKRIKEQSPETTVIMITAYASIETAIEAMKSGAYDYIMKPFKVDEIKLVIRRALEQKALSEENRYLRQELKSKFGFPEVIGTSDKIQEIYKKVEKIAKTESTILITGESGTGKEMAARAIHYNSLRSERQFVAVDCAALPESLLESELFGHTKGAFTSAVSSKDGLFKVADGGTIFLDEIGEIDTAMQVKLLRALQERVIKPVGSTENIKIDVRVIAATSRNLEDMIKRGSFRKELYYRLNVIPIDMPPLRERRDDIPILANYFLKKYADKLEKETMKISPEAMNLLTKYGWPGNVRELENVIERAVSLSERNIILPQDLHESLQHLEPSLIARRINERSLDMTVDSFEKELIIKTLAEFRGNQYQTAKKLGISRQNLQYKIKKYEINRAEARNHFL